MKPLFSSLGSNYSWRDTFSALLGGVRVRDRRPVVTSLLKRWFGGEVFLTYKGRDAIEIALKTHGIGVGDGVLTQAFACAAIEEAILRVGAVPVYVDVQKEHLSFSLETLESLYKKYQKNTQKTIKAVLIQYTLGSTYPTKKLAAWCKQQGLLLIEDLAQGLGGEAQTGELLGTFGDVTVLSFGRDKVADAVTGGAVVFRTGSFAPVSLKKPPFFAVFRDMLYPLVVKIGTSTFSIGFGKAWLWVAKRIGLLTSPTSSVTTLATEFPRSLAPLVLRQLRGVTASIEHRRDVAKKYYQVLSELPGVTLYITKEDIQKGSCLRVPVVLHTSVAVGQLVSTCQRQGIFLSDRWYREPVDGGVGWSSSVYEKGSCPHAEMAAGVIVNLPTHRYIGRSEVKRILAAVKEVVQTV